MYAPKHQHAMPKPVIQQLPKMIALRLRWVSCQPCVQMHAFQILHGQYTTARLRRHHLRNNNIGEPNKPVKPAQLFGLMLIIQFFRQLMFNLMHHPIDKFFARYEI